MYKNLFASIFIHLFIFIIFAISHLFLYKTINLHTINVSLISNSSVVSFKYTPLELRKKAIEELSNTSNTTNSTDIKSINGKGDSLDGKEKLIVKENVRNIAPDLVQKTHINKSATKDNVISKSENVKKVKDINYENNSLSNKQKERELFTKNILSGLDKGKISKEQLQALSNQIKGCWYNQSGYSAPEDFQVEMILTMNKDRSIKNIVVRQQNKYKDTINKAILEQTLRALKDPKCKYLELPMGSFNNWRIIHLVFNPKE